MSMVHSLWQAALFLLVYVVVNKIFLQKSSPLAKRNLLFAMLAAQMLLFILTFFVYLFSTGPVFSESSFAEMSSRYFPAEGIALITPWIFSTYVFIVCFKLIKAMYTWYHFKKQYLPGLQKPGIDLKLFMESKAHQFGIKRKVKLWFSATINTPVTFGFLKPVILLPVALLNNITPQQAETLILHELTHIRTNDYLLNWFLLIAETVFFYNPFVNTICNNIKLEREKNCDMNVIAFEYEPALYAATLLQAERIKKLVPDFQLAAVSRKKQLLQRILFFSESKSVASQRQINFTSPLVGIILAFALYTVFLFRPGASSPSMAMAEIPAGILPLSDYEYDAGVIKNTDLPGYKKISSKSLLKKIETQSQAIEKRVKRMQPLLRSIEQKAGELAGQLDNNFVIPVTEKENDAATQIIIEEQTSGSRSSSVKVYCLRFQNGQWVIQPEWMAAAKEIAAEDEPGKKHDSSKRSKKLLPPQ